MDPAIRDRRVDSKLGNKPYENFEYTYLRFTTSDHEAVMPPATKMSPDVAGDEPQ
jgi:hypothetical protein